MIQAYTNNFGDGVFSGMLVMEKLDFITTYQNEGDDGIKRRLVSQANISANDISYTVESHSKHPNLIKVLWRTKKVEENDANN